MPYGRRIDSNQKEIVTRLRQLGAKVAITSSLGNGFPDLVVGLNDSKCVRLVEIKDGSKPRSAQKLTPDEEKFHSEWKGMVDIVSSVLDAENLYNYWNQEVISERE